MNSISIGEALSLWLSGAKLDGYSIIGVPVVWIGRAAKLVAYLAGLTVILDILGPEKVREFGQRISQRTIPLWKVTVLSTMFVGVFLTVIALTAIFYRLSTGRFRQGFGELVVSIGLPVVIATSIIFVIRFFGPRFIVWIGRSLERPRGELVIRWIGLAAFTIAVSADLFAS